MFLQEHRLPSYEADEIFSNDFSQYRFITISQDMFTNIEDLNVQRIATWHGTALGGIKRLIVTFPSSYISNRFCGFKYESNVKMICYSVYVAASGQDNEFVEILSNCHLIMSK